MPGIYGRLGHYALYIWDDRTLSLTGMGGWDTMLFIYGRLGHWALEVWEVGTQGQASEIWKLSKCASGEYL